MIDGSELGQIHCFNNSLSCSTGAVLLKRAMEALDEDLSFDTYCHFVILLSVKSVRVFII